MIVRIYRRALCHLVLTSVLLALCLGILGAPSQARANDLIYQLGGIAIQGYDPVAYFTDGQAVKGSDAFAYEWLGAIWHFASAEHRDLFAADPVRYAPQFGGYCADSVGNGAVSTAGPNEWRIVDGKLYLFGSHSGQMEWATDAPERIKKANVQWEVLKADLTE